jgi:hypothetical protein
VTRTTQAEQDVRIEPPALSDRIMIGPSPLTDHFTQVKGIKTMHMIRTRSSHSRHATSGTTTSSSAFGRLSIPRHDDLLQPQGAVRQGLHHRCNKVSSKLWQGV